MMTRRASAVAAIMIGVLAIISGLSAITIQSSYESNLASERSKLRATAQVAAELMAQKMIAVEDIEQATLQRSAFISAIGSGSGAGVDGSLQTVLNQVQALRPEFQFVAVSDARGTTRATSPSDASVVGRNFGFRDWYSGALSSGRSYVSTAYVSAVHGAPLVVAVATPIRAPAAAAKDAPSTGPVIGFLFIGYKIGSVQVFADRLAGLQQINLQLTDQAGVIMARQGGISGQLVKASGAPEVAAALDGGVTTITTATGMAAGVPVAGLGWTVSASTPLSGTAAAKQRTTSALIAASLLILLGIAGTALFVMMRRLERADSRHASGEAELRTVLHALTDAIQVFNPDGSLVHRNPAAERIYELGADDRTTAAVAAKWELLREDGSSLSMEDGPLAMAMRTGKTTESIVVGTRKIVDGAVKWLSISTVPIRSPQSKVSGYVSAARDITERTQTIRELHVLGRAAEQLSSSLVPDQVVRALTTTAAELCSAPGERPRRAQVFLIDGPMMVMVGEHNPEGSVESEGVHLAIADHPYIQRVIATHDAVIAELNYEECGPVLADVMRRSEITNCVWIPMTRTNAVFAVLAVAGRQHDLISAAQLERLKTLATIGQLALSNAEAHERVAALARTDPLTGLGNRRALDDRLRRPPRTQFAVVAIDVDDLKKVNDTHGHDAGDELLAKLAAALLAELRPSDVLARTGGDEFVAMLLDCDAHGAIELCKRLRRATAQVPFPWGTASISVGSAAGAAGEAADAVAKAADLDLYAAKQKAKSGARPNAATAAGRT